MSFHEFARARESASRTFRIDPTHLVTLIDKLHQFIFVKDCDGQFVYANPNFLELMGVGEEGLYGKRDIDFFPRAISEGFARADQKVRSSGEDWEGQETIPFPAGGTRIVWCNKTPLRDNQTQRIIGVVGIFADTTKNHQRHAQAVTQRTNDLVHEILIPMQSISSNLDNLISAENGVFEMTREERLGALSVSLSELHILGMHAENMQRALVGDEQQEMVFRQHSIRTVLGDCIDALKPAAEIKSITIRSPALRGAREFPRMEMSRPELTRAFKNLYHNAVKYSYSGRGLGADSPYEKRWISTEVGEVAGERWYVQIQNYGVGIAADEIATIFDEGTRGRYSIDRHRTGSGIGLSQVKRIVERHNGTVSITSEKRGNPWVTTVRVELPLVQPEEVIRYDDNIEDALG